jgi:hypothetical protein
MWFPLTIALVCIMGFSFFSKTADGVSEIFLIDDLNIFIRKVFTQYTA